MGGRGGGWKRGWVEGRVGGRESVDYVPGYGLWTNSIVKS